MRNGYEIEIEARRELGTGHWDRKLMKNLVELSIADNYNEAKDEWIATGNVWWEGMSDTPDWMKHSGSCLCGHRVKYHFHILNTENGNEDVVGSDHINTYMIRREISLSTGISEEHITEEQIKEWMNVRIESMKADAWWKTNGEWFTKQFEDIREYDLRMNVREKNIVWNHAEGKYVYDTVLRKKGSGDPTDEDYEMASIVWRWNHPDNSRNQRDGRGYPNEKLQMDLAIFWAKVQMMKDELISEDKKLEEMTQKVLENQSRTFQEKQQTTFEERCAYFGIPAFDSSWGYNDWSRTFLADMKRLMTAGRDLTQPQQNNLLKIIRGNQATEKQISYLRDLGYDGEMNISKSEASNLISKYLLEE